MRALRCSPTAPLCSFVAWKIAAGSLICAWRVRHTAWMGGRSIANRHSSQTSSGSPRSYGASKIRASRICRNSSNMPWLILRIRVAVPECLWHSRKIIGSWALIHRPMTPLGAHIWISYSPDLRHWGNHKLMLEARRGAWWDANKIGMSPPPIETSRGWLMIYHGVRRTPSSSIYRLGLALFDLEQPEKCLIRGDSWMFAPEAEYERHGDVQDVVFPCGYTVATDGDTINLYYGAADSSIALAQGSIRSLLAWLDANGHSEQAHDRRQRQS